MWKRKKKSKVKTLLFIIIMNAGQQQAELHESNFSEQDS